MKNVVAVLSCALLGFLTSEALAAVRFYSQSGQDRFVYTNFFINKRDGIFVDIGAHDGITYSNTYFFEKHLGWKGICIEPIPEVFARLRNNRNCVCVEGCIYDKADTVKFLRVRSNIGEHTEMLSGIVDNYDSRHLARITMETANDKGSYEEIMVRCYKLNEILASYGIDHVDYLSLDTEGGELEILKSINFETIDIAVIDVENNYNSPEFETFLSSKGYKKVKNLSGDEIYVKNSWYQRVIHTSSKKRDKKAL